MNAPAPPSAAVPPAPARLSFVERWLFRRRLAKGFDSAWLRWLLSLSLLFSVLLSGAILGGPLKTSGKMLLAGVGAASALWVFYWGHLLFRRLQCSLLEWCLLILVFGNVEAFLVTSPELAFFRPWSWLLPPLAAGWVLHGAVMGLARARLLSVTRSGPRAWLLISGWLTSAAPALLLMGAALFAGRFYFPGGLPREMRAWMAGLLLIGGAGLALRIVLARRCRRAARAALASGAAQARLDERQRKADRRWLAGRVSFLKMAILLLAIFLASVYAIFFVLKIQ